MSRANANELIFTECYKENKTAEKFELDVKNIVSSTELIDRLIHIFIGEKASILTSSYFIMAMKDRQASSKGIELVIYNFKNLEERCRFDACELIAMFKDFILPYSENVKNEKFNVFVIE